METSNNSERAASSRASGPRHSILDLAPLELECLSVLWPMGESTVRDIHRALAASRPRAYTTVMTIMDRLEHKGVVTRRKVGKAFLYQPKLSAEEARLKAVEKIVEGFFDGSPAALLAVLSAVTPPVAPSAPRAKGEFLASAPPAVDAPGTSVTELRTQNLDETLL